MMILNRWEVWLTFSTCLTSDSIDLAPAAEELVRSGAALIAMLPDGCFYADIDGKLQKGEARVATECTGAESQISIPQWLPGYSREALLTASLMRAREYVIFDQTNPLQPPSLRAFLGEIRLENDECSVSLFPILRLYEDGVALLSLRYLGPSGPISHEHFVNHFLGLRRKEYDTVSFPPGVARFFAESSLSSYASGPLRRLKVLRTFKRFGQHIRENSYRLKSGDFEFDFFSVEQTENSEPATFSSLATGLFDGVGCLLRRPRTRFHFVLFGDAPAGGYSWWAHPHIHLMSFAGQRRLASQNERKHICALGSVISGICIRRKNQAAQFLPRNLRVLDDYGAYINSTGTLWVHTPDSLRGHWYRSDSGRRSLSLGAVVENQIVAEALDYTHVTYRELARRSAMLNRDFRQVLKRRAALVDLEMRAREGSVFGELRDLMKAGLDAYGIPEIRSVIRENLEIKLHEASYRFNRRTSRWAAALSILFGVGAIPTFARYFLSPVLALCGLTRPAPPFAELPALVLSTVVLAVVLILVRARINREGEVGRGSSSA
jgi:hypothetical protein